MNKKIFAISIFVLLDLTNVVAQKSATVSLKEFKCLIGCWQGTLNYSGTIIRKPYTTTAELVVKQILASNKFEFINIYTKDPKENVADTITVSGDGRKLNEGNVKSKQYTKDGNIEIITEALGFDHDNNKAALVRQTYTIGKKLYNYKKQVQVEGQEDWLDRQEFTYSRKPCQRQSY